MSNFGRLSKWKCWHTIITFQTWTCTLVRMMFALVTTSQDFSQSFHIKSYNLSSQLSYLTVAYVFPYKALIPLTALISGRIMKSHGTMGIAKGGVNLHHIRARLTSENVTSGHNRREPSNEYQNGLGFWDRKPSIWWVCRQRSDRRTVGDFPSNIPSARSSSLNTVLDTSLNVVWHLQLPCNSNFKCKSFWKFPAKQSCQK